MQITEPTRSQIEQWKETFRQYKNRLTPNRKNPQELIQYLIQKYPVCQVENNEGKQVVIDNIMNNEYFRKKLKSLKKVNPIVFRLMNEGTGKELYKNQADVFTGIDIMIGIDQETGYFIVEGSTFLWNELYAYMGVDKEDIGNFYLVAEYINCLKKFNPDSELLIAEPRLAADSRRGAPETS